MVVVTSLGPPDEGVRATQEHTEVYMNQKSLGNGTLYISEARVSWVGIGGQGFSLMYPHIAMHAVSKDLTVFHSECLYLMIDVKLMDSTDTTPMSTPSSSNPGSDDEDDMASEDGMTEIRFIPDDKSRLEALYQALSECAALHPDEEASELEEEYGEEDEEEGMYDDAEEGAGDVGEAQEHANGHAPAGDGQAPAGDDDQMEAD